MTIDMIKAYLYNYCKNFNSLNNIYLNVKCSKQDIQEIYTLYGIEIEFFEDEYLLETLNNDINKAIKILQNELNKTLYCNYKIKKIFVNKKKEYDKNDMNKMIIIKDLESGE